LNSRTSPCPLSTRAVHLLDTLPSKDISKGLALGALSQVHLVKEREKYFLKKYFLFFMLK
jgi:hypothetical protein